jgi:hypothetical protein
MFSGCIDTAKKKHLTATNFFFNFTIPSSRIHFAAFQILKFHIKMEETEKTSQEAPIASQITPDSNTSSTAAEDSESQPTGTPPTTDPPARTVTGVKVSHWLTLFKTITKLSSGSSSQSPSSAALSSTPSTTPS